MTKTVHLNHPCMAAHTSTRQQPHSARLQWFPQTSEVALHSCTYHSKGSRRQCNATLIIIIRIFIQSSKVKRNWWKNLFLLHSQVFLHDKHIKSNNAKIERWTHEIPKTVTTITPHEPIYLSFIQFIQITRLPKLAVHFTN